LAQGGRSAGAGNASAQGKYHVFGNPDLAEPLGAGLYKVHPLFLSFQLALFRVLNL